MPQAVLIIGEDPELVDFSAPGVPPNMSAKTVMEGVRVATDRLKGLGNEVRRLADERRRNRRRAGVGRPEGARRTTSLS